MSKIPSKSKGVICGVTGGIAAYKVCDVIANLVKKEVAVRCIMTKNATQFITPLTLQTLTRERVLTDQFEYDPRLGPVHISLSEFAQLLLIMPATANVIAKMAQGIADDLLTTVALSSTCPIVVVPAMNTRMWEHEATQNNVAILKRRGISFVGPVEGRLSCGTVGIGHIAESDDVLAAIYEYLQPRGI